ncbi:hypothetical protein chiPu_0006744 [Chiloscyllium punctatum]|uniref:Uncharacterized protein n=1 Tax=Chiloscyllium punctatum TaxID=137246 RepID=A0A401SD46_CHIPU|nr:hypothetical protein [Chiloscyllium punctatum]
MSNHGIAELLHAPKEVKIVPSIPERKAQDSDRGEGRFGTAQREHVTDSVRLGNKMEMEYPVITGKVGERRGKE